MNLRWRTGRKLGRTLYKDDVCVGMVDSTELASEIVEAMNFTEAMRASGQDQTDVLAQRDAALGVVSETNRLAMLDRIQSANRIAALEGSLRTMEAEAYQQGRGAERSDIVKWLREWLGRRDLEKK